MASVEPMEISPARAGEINFVWTGNVEIVFSLESRLYKRIIQDDRENMSLLTNSFGGLKWSERKMVHVYDNGTYVHTY